MLAVAVVAVAVVAAASLAGLPAAAQTRPATVPTATHDRAFWQAIVDSDYALPEGASAPALLVELHGLLGSRDPELRDDFAYGITAAWLYRDERLSGDELRQMLDRLLANLRQGIGETGTDSVLLRSFSALDLSLIAAFDNQRPFLTPDEFGRFLDATLAYLSDEKDVRDWVDGVGWLHASAHTADVLKFLARSRHLTPAQQQRILDAIAAKLTALTTVFTHGEDERLARVVLSLLSREDAAADALRKWLDASAASAEGLWQTKPFDHARYIQVQNRKQLLRSLFVLTAGKEALAEPTQAIQEALGKM